MKFTPEQKIHYALRIASAMCFIGHGAFGIITKEIWANYFGVFGISHDLSFQLMPLVGIVDILCGLLILLYPVRAVLLWLVAWGTITAFLRPLSGEPFAEFLERAGNFGAPLALVILSASPTINIKMLFKPVTAGITLDKKRLGALINCLRCIAFLIFLGHGWLNLAEKKSLVSQYTSLGFTYGGNIAQLIGLFEIVAAFSILIRPIRALVLAFFIWKITSELFYPRYEMLEWIERGGSYGVLLALWFAFDLLPAFDIAAPPSLRKMFVLQKGRSGRESTFTNYDAYTK